MQSGQETGRGSWTTLIGVQELWLTVTFQGPLHGLEAERRVKSVGWPPTETMPGEEIKHGQQQTETF